MRFLVTGGAGFIGSNLVRLLLAADHEVVVLDDLSTGTEQNLASLDGPLALVVGSIEEADLVARHARGVDGIFHLAAVASVQRSLVQPEACHSVNVTGTLHVLEAARRAGVPRVVLSSSAAVYGEADAFPLAEGVPARPISPYGLHKRINEEYGQLYTDRGWTEVVALRYFNVYGPRQDPDGDYAAVVPKFITALLAGEAPTVFGDGRQSRDFMFVEDVARANLAAMTTLSAAGGIFNVCAGTETSLLDLLEALARAIPEAPPARFEPAKAGDIRRSVGSDDAIRAALLLPPWIPVAEGLRQTVDWYRHG